MGVLKKKSKKSRWGGEQERKERVGETKERRKRKREGQTDRKRNISPMDNSFALCP